MKTIKKINLIFLTLFIATVFFALVSIGFNATCSLAYAMSNSELSYDYEYIPIESVEATTRENTRSARPGEEVELDVRLEPWYAEKTVKSIEFFILEGEDLVDANQNAKIVSGKLFILEQAIVGETIDIVAIADGQQSEVLSIEVVKIPVETVIFNITEITINQGETYTLPISITPNNASFKDVEYIPIRGGEYFSYLDNNQIKINNFIGRGDAQIELSAIVDGVPSSNSIVISIFVPVDEVSLSASNFEPVLGSTITFTVGLGYATIQEHSYVVVCGQEYIDSFLGDKLVIKSAITADSPSITLYAVCNGKESSQITLNIRIPITGINAERVAFSVNEGSTVVLPTLTVLPSNATNKVYIYSIIAGSEHVNGNISNAQFKIKDSVSVSNGKIIVRATSISDNNKYLDLTYNIIVPIKSVSISSNSNVLTSTDCSGTSLTITPTFNLGQTAPTSESITYYVSEGLSYVDKSVILSGNILRSNNIKVEKGIFGTGVIKVYAVAGSQTSNTLTFSIYVPVQSITISSTQQRGTTITPKVNSNATNPKVEITSYTVKKYGSQPITYYNTENTDYFNTSKNSQFFVPTYLVAGSEVSITYKATESGGINRTCTFTIGTLSPSDFTVSYSKDYKIDNNGTKSYRWDITESQLETGYSVDVIIKYRGGSLPAGVTASLTNVSANAIHSGMTLSVDENDSGNDGINYNVTIFDGNDRINLGTNVLKNFRRANGQPTSTTSVIFDREARLDKGAGTLISVAKPTGFYSKDDLSFVPVNGDKYSLTADGLLTIKSSSIPSIITVQMTLPQRYNGHPFDASNGNAWNVNIKIKTMNIDKQSGTGGSTGPIISVNDITGGIDKPTRTGYDFGGYYTGTNGTGVQYFTESGARSSSRFTSSYSTLYAYWIPWTYTFREYSLYNGEEKNSVTLKYTYGKEYTWDKGDNPDWTFEGWRLKDNSGERIVSTAATYTIKTPNVSKNGEVTLCAVWTKDSCVATGTKITLADGTQKMVENLDGSESLLVWNLWTGKFDTAPVLFMDSDASTKTKVINLLFDDDTVVKVITEHGFWDYNLNQYVFLREDAEQYVGHYFAKEELIDGEMVLQKVKLENVTVTEEVTAAWSPVTLGHLCYFVNGMLSMPGATESFINIFDVDPETMKYDEVKMRMDILNYGLFSYDDFADVLPEEMFEAFGGAYLKVSIAKGNTTIEEIYSLIEHYSKFLNK